MPRFRAATIFCSLALLAPGAMRGADQAPGISPSPTSAAAGGLSPQQAHDLLHALDDACVGVYEKVAPSVVIIEADKRPSDDDQDQSFDFYFHSPENGAGGGKQQQAQPSHPPQEPSVRSEGSGFVIRPDGYIFTNFHVVEDADRIDVKLRDRRHFPAKLVGADERTDIAVLKIDATGLPPVEMVNSDSVRVGQMCFAIGIPYNLDYSFCRGVVSAKGRSNLTATPNKPMYEDYIQTDAFINPGNSGGPLFDIDGRVMGMNTLINGVGRGLAFAIPSNMLTDIGGELIANGHVDHAWLGITVSTLDDERDGPGHVHGPAEGGVSVDTIEADAPAYKSDLRPRDVIIKVDGVSVLSAHDLQHEIMRKKVGQSVDLNVWRTGKIFDIALVTDAMPTNFSQIAQNHSRAKTSFYEMYGLELAPPSHAPAAGAAVNGVISDTPASRAGVQTGDMITSVDDKPVADTNTCMQMLGSRGSQSRIVLVMQRKGQKTRAILDMGEKESPVSTPHP